jgi:hypothetical protein
VTGAGTLYDRVLAANAELRRAGTQLVSALLRRPDTDGEIRRCTDAAAELLELHRRHHRGLGPLFAPWVIAAVGGERGESLRDLSAEHLLLDYHLEQADVSLDRVRNPDQGPYSGDRGGELLVLTAVFESLRRSTEAHLDAEELHLGELLPCLDRASVLALDAELDGVLG